MKKLILSTIIIFAVLAIFCGGSYAASQKSRVFDIEYESKDNFILHSTLTYPEEQKNIYPMVVLLHSIGYSSSYWGSLVPDLNKAGFATLEIDLKGHGKSATDIYFKRRSWIYFDDKTFQSFPEEVVEILKQTLSEHKNLSQNYISYIGADIGANMAIWVAQMNNPKPVCLVLISPYMNFKGLDVPIKLANAGSMPILAIAAQKDLSSVKQLSDIEKYAQGAYFKKLYPNGGTGMMMLKLNKHMSVDIVNWVVEKVNLKK